MWLDGRVALVIALTLLASALAIRNGSSRWQSLRPYCVEAALVLVLYAVWMWVGIVTASQTDGAFRNADTIVRVERFFHIPSEEAWQRAILPYPVVVQAANLFYAVVHVPALIVALVWCFARHRDRYRAFRNLVALTTLGCLLVQLIPVAPPRMLAGFVDTGIVYGQSVYGPNTVSADQVAAMPSLHVGWAVLVALVVITASQSRWRWWILAHPIVTTVVVVVTANHWWLDGVGAVVVIGAAEGVRRTWSLGWDRIRVRALAPAS